MAAAVLALALLAGMSVADAGDSVKARLISPNAAIEANGTLTLNGYSLAGHLSGEGIDVAISGTVKSSNVSVVVTGRISPSCNLNTQSMSGDAPNQGANTSISFDFFCTTKAGNWGGGQDYLFRLELGLPPHHLQIPTGTDPGEGAAIEPLSGEVQRNLA